MVGCSGFRKDRQSKASRRSRYAGRNRRRRDSGNLPDSRHKVETVERWLADKTCGINRPGGNEDGDDGVEEGRGGVGRTSKQGGKMGLQARRNLGKKRSRAYTKKAEHRAVII
ncbi:hypothetical protein CIHG_01673 [Coccidioides immitis H538.4]|uniref:Uncharacterized protein n=3 Tax=Coccidioides immitis TaxID=5501 RepID=A0A0J8R6K4_COCIT|nr:hypothetical protein CIRG_06003 [Coccidioides immitis RMSCC 2394]KMU80476.1 hypothetical protein CISG_02327 [Coccidioides immitis RMSCC 3703]KMU83889.1 hypothetical protein CIHG_01673 [Coccidioides immitis H538.4]